MGVVWACGPGLSRCLRGWVRWCVAAHGCTALRGHRCVAVEVYGCAGGIGGGCAWKVLRVCGCAQRCVGVCRVCQGGHTRAGLCGGVAVPRPAVCPLCGSPPGLWQGVPMMSNCQYPQFLSPCAGYRGAWRPWGDMDTRLPRALAAPASPATSISFGCVVACWILWLLVVRTRRRRVMPRKEQRPEVTLSHWAHPSAVIHYGLGLSGAQALGGLRIWVGDSA